MAERARRRTGEASNMEAELVFSPSPSGVETSASGLVSDSGVPSGSEVVSGSGSVSAVESPSAWTCVMRRKARERTASLRTNMVMLVVQGGDGAQKQKKEAGENPKLPATTSE